MIVDQAEELFTIASADDRVAFAHYLNALQRSLTTVRLAQPRRERKKGKRRP